MVEKNDADLQSGFVKAGYPELYPEFRQQFPAAKVESVSIAPGEDLAWMLFRTNGTGPVTVVRDVTWNGEAAFDAFSFSIVMQGQRYVFIVPAVCGNLSLRTVDTVAETLTNKDPLCTMTLSNSEIACGQVVIADATGSSDSDGTIAQVVFQLLDDANTVVAEKSDTEAPYIQEFTIPCDSPRYTIKTVVIDNSGAAPSSAECTKAVTVAARKGGPVVDVGLSHQFDPASYAFARVGYGFSISSFFMRGAQDTAVKTKDFEDTVFFAVFPAGLIVSRFVGP